MEPKYSYYTQPPLLHGIQFNQRNLILGLERGLGDTCTAFEYYRRGAYHHTFVATFTSERRLLVRVQDLHSDAPQIRRQTPTNKMSSECATIEYVREHTKIPVPKVLLYDEDAEGLVGAQWMVQEIMPGVPLRAVWHKMLKEQHRRVCLSVVEVWAELLSQRFQTIGSLYQRSNGTYAVGPMTFAPSCDPYSVAPPNPTKCGPFATVKDWLVAMARRDLDFISDIQRTEAEQDQINTAMEKIQNYSAREVKGMNDPTSITNCSFALQHVDLHPQNILVDESDYTKITAVLDWEGARIIPLFAMDLKFIVGIEREDPDENLQLQTIMSKELASRSPEWERAMSEQGQDLRLLHVVAMSSHYCRYLPLDHF